MKTIDKNVSTQNKQIVITKSAPKGANGISRYAKSLTLLEQFDIGAIAQKE